MRDMHVWDDHTELFAHSVIGYAIERLQLPKDTRWGQHPAGELAADLAGAISADGRGGIAALHLFRDVILPACRPNDDPMHLAYVGTAPSIAATMFDLVLSTSSVFAGLWEAGAGAIAAENQALRWLADLAGFPSHGRRRVPPRRLGGQPHGARGRPPGVRVAPRQTGALPASRQRPTCTPRSAWPRG